MKIVELINQDIVLAMKNSDKETLSTLRMAKNALQMAKISKNHELSEDEVISVLRSQIKQKQDSILEYEKYQKDDAVANLKQEIVLLNKYLPALKSPEEIAKTLDEVFAELKPTSIKDMGIVMKKAIEILGSSV